MRKIIMHSRSASAACILSLLILSGCGGGDGGNSQAPATGSTTTASAGPNWDPLDACAALGKDAAGEASGSPVTSTQLLSVVKGTDSTAAFSSCMFQLANGGQLMLLVRKSPVADVNASAIEAARTSGGMAPPSVDVPGLGKAALWGEQTKTLQVFADDTHFLTVTYMSLPAGADANAQAIAVAKKLM